MTHDDPVTLASVVPARTASYVFPSGRSHPLEPLSSWADTWIFAKPDLIPLHLTWICTLGLAFFAYWAWHDTQDQLALLRDQQRAWIDVTAATGSVCFDEDDAREAYAIELKNVGKSPALGIPILVEKDASACEQERVTSYSVIAGHRVVSRGSYKAPSTAIFPTNHAKSNFHYRTWYYGSAPFWEVNGVKEYANGAKAYVFKSKRVACITYKYSGSDVLHKTLVTLHSKAVSTTAWNKGDCATTDTKFEIEEAD